MLEVIRKRMIINGVDDVLTAARKRIEYIFDNYEKIQLSFSGGKDSSVLFHLMYEEAEKRNRKFYVFFLDQEAEYQGTIDLVEWVMQRPLVIPMWYQVPLFMTNASSSEQLFLYAWGRDEEWSRDKNPLAIQELKCAYPKRFYKFVNWVDKRIQKYEGEGEAITIIGLRAEESPERRFVMFGEDNDLFWIRRKRNPHRAYPIIDWSYRDVWKYLIDNNKKYNSVYDKLYSLGVKLRDIRVSCLIHEKAYRCLAELQEVEPETYDKLQKRLKGVHTAGIYGRENMMYSIKKRPDHFKTWKDYYLFLFENLHEDLKVIFKYQWSRFEGYEDTRIYKYFCKRIILCDWEGNIKLKDDINYTKEQLAKKRKQKKTDEVIQKWFNL